MRRPRHRKEPTKAPPRLISRVTPKPAGTTGTTGTPHELANSSVVRGQASVQRHVRHLELLGLQLRHPEPLRRGKQDYINYSTSRLFAAVYPKPSPTRDRIAADRPFSCIWIRSNAR